MRCALSTLDAWGDFDVAEWVACSEHLERSRASRHNMIVVVQSVRYAPTLDCHNSAIRVAAAVVTTPAGRAAGATLEPDDLLLCDSFLIHRER